MLSYIIGTKSHGTPINDERLANEAMNFAETFMKEKEKRSA